MKILEFVGKWIGIAAVNGMFWQSWEFAAVTLLFAPMVPIWSELLKGE